MENSIMITFFIGTIGAMLSLSGIIFLIYCFTYEMKNKKKLYKESKILAGIGIIIGIIMFFIMLIKLKISFIGVESKNEILSNIINFIAISTGFLMTTLSILAAASNSKVMKKLAKYKKIKQLNMFFIEPIVVSIILIIICIIEIGLTKSSIVENIMAALIISLSINFILDFFRIGYLCINILQEIMEENFKENKKEIPVQPNVERAFSDK